MLGARFGCMDGDYICHRKYIIYKVGDNISATRNICYIRSAIIYLPPGIYKPIPVPRYICLLVRSPVRRRAYTVVMHGHTAAYSGNRRMCQHRLTDSTTPNKRARTHQPHARKVHLEGKIETNRQTDPGQDRERLRTPLDLDCPSSPSTDITATYRVPALGNGSSCSNGKL